MSVPVLLAIYFVSLGGGWLIAGTCVFFMRRSVGIPRPFFKGIDIWVGFTERLIATTLVLLAPKLLPGFVGGWIALKFAAHWQRDKSAGAKQASLVFLVGSAISFAIAIGAGVLANPAAMSRLNGL